MMDQSIPIFLSESRLQYTKQPYCKSEQVVPKDSLDLAHANQDRHGYVTSSQASFLSHPGFKPDFLDYDQLQRIKKVSVNIGTFWHTCHLSLGDPNLDHPKLSES